MRSNLYIPFIYKRGGVWYWRSAMFPDDVSNEVRVVRNVLARYYVSRMNRYVSRMNRHENGQK